jgi:hypothetical protein
MQTEGIEQIGAFRQFDRKKHEQQGLGLGLILVQRLTARNGATFNLMSLPERGIQDRIGFVLEETKSEFSSELLPLENILPKYSKLGFDNPNCWERLRGLLTAACG